MKVAIVCDVLGKKNNGTTVAAYNLIEYLKSKGHEVIVLCPDKDKKGQEGFVILKTRYLGPINPILRRNGVSLAQPNRKLIENTVKDCDVIHCMLPFISGHSACKTALKYNIPITSGFHAQPENVTCHLGMENIECVNRWIFKWFYNRVYKYMDAIHYPTQFARDIFERIVGPTPGYVISNGVKSEVKHRDIPKPEKFKDKYVLFNVGRLCGEKAHMVALKAVEMSKYAKDIQLIFAGAGPLHDKIVKYAKKHLPVPLIIDFLPRQEMLEIFNYADLYVHPGEVELESVACLEAIVCGQVIIVSDSKNSATKNFALSENNIFKCGNAEDLKNKIEYWIEHPKEKAEYKQKYLNYGENFDQQECMAKMEQMMFDVIEKKKNTCIKQ